MAFTSCCPLSWRSFCFRCVVVDPCSIHCHIPLQKILFPRLNSFKQSFESSTCCCFWSGVSKRGTHLENNLRISKDLCHIVNTLRSDICKVSAISQNFNLWSPKTILWTFVMFSGTIVDFVRSERSTSSVLVGTRSNSAYQSMIVQCLINTRNSFVSIVLEMTKVASSKPL